MSAEESSNISAASVPISQPCFRFYQETQRILDFTLFTFSLVNERDDRAIRLAKGIQFLSRGLLEWSSTEAETNKWEATIAEYEHMAQEGLNTRRIFKEFGSLFSRMIHCKAVDNFLAYLSEVLALIFTTRPEILSGKHVSMDSVLRARNTQEIISALAEREVNELSYQGMEDLSKYLKKRLDFELFTTDHKRSRAIVAVELRNIIVHNRGIINQRFLERVPNYKAAVGDTVDLEGQLMDLIVFFVDSVAGIDRRAGEKFGIPLDGPHMTSREVIEPRRHA
jgi:hypothetical protein